MLSMKDLMPNGPNIDPPLMHPDPQEQVNPIVSAEPWHSEVAVKQVKTFCDLPTKEIDEIVRAARAEIEALEMDAQNIRNLYVEYTERLTRDINRLREGVKLSMGTMKELREQCSNLDKGPGD